MRDFSENGAELDPLLRESLGWIVRLTSGEATQADADAFGQWQARSSEHEKALREALRLRQMLRTAGGELVARQPVQLQSRRTPSMLGRRAVLGGALAACAVGGMYGGADLGLWPALSELGADYRTGTGEQRKVALAT